MVSRKVLGGSPRFRGVVVYDNGVARPTIYNPFLGANVIEPSRSPTRYYGYNNESSPAASQILQVNGSGVSQMGGWSTLQGFNIDIAWRAGWIFATSGQIFKPERGIQVGSFSNTPVTDDAASGRYFLVSARYLACDQNTLLPVGATALTGVTGASGSLIRCGTNGFAVRVSTSKIALFRTHSFRAELQPSFYFRWCLHRCQSRPAIRSPIHLPFPTRGRTPRKTWC